MSFTDDDLKRFQKWLFDCSMSDKFYCRTTEIKSLLARLEAAEDVASHVTDCPITLLDKWKKSKGEL
jgi:hypothetical protein